MAASGYGASALPVATPDTMRAAIVSGAMGAHDSFKPEAMTVETWPVPTFQDDEVLIIVHKRSDSTYKTN